MTPKLSLKPFVLKSTFEFMINTAPQASNSAYGKDDCFKVNTFTEPTIPQQRNLWELTPRTRGARSETIQVNGDTISSPRLSTGISAKNVVLKGQQTDPVLGT